MRLTIHVKPNAKETALLEKIDDQTLRIAIAEVPQENAVNVALLRFLADLYEVPLSSIHFVSGLKSKTKVVEIAI